MSSLQPQLTSSVVMVKPLDFGYNPQTAMDNCFQNKPSQSEKAIQAMAMKEFTQAQKQLEDLGIEIISLGKSPSNSKQPDAVFPNNWFSTHANGDLYIFPMKTPNRQQEIQLEPLTKALSTQGYLPKRIIDLRQAKPPKVLEGTGAMVFHHPSQTIFAALSERCTAAGLDEFKQKIHYQLLSFDTTSQSGLPVYHTNVVMSCGEDFIVIAEDIIQENQRDSLLKAIDARVNHCLRITEQQMAESFCGNILQLVDKQQQPVIALSQTAYRGFKPEQIRLLEQQGSLAVLPIETIEKVGGGSARCMLAENHLPRSS